MLLEVRLLMGAFISELLDFDDASIADFEITDEVPVTEFRPREEVWNLCYHFHLFINIVYNQQCFLGIHYLSLLCETQENHLILFEFRLCSFLPTIVKIMLQAEIRGAKTTTHLNRDGGSTHNQNKYQHRKAQACSLRAPRPYAIILDWDRTSELSPVNLKCGFMSDESVECIIITFEIMLNSMLCRNNGSLIPLTQEIQTQTRILRKFDSYPKIEYQCQSIFVREGIFVCFYPFAYYFSKVTKVVLKAPCISPPVHHDHITIICKVDHSFSYTVQLIALKLGEFCK